MNREFADTSGGSITPELHQQLLAMHCEQPVTAAAAAERCGITLLQFTAWLKEQRTRDDLAALRYSADHSMHLFLGQQRISAIVKLLEICNEGKGETARRASKDLLMFNVMPPPRPETEHPTSRPQRPAWSPQPGTLEADIMQQMDQSIRELLLPPKKPAAPGSVASAAVSPGAPGAAGAPGSSRSAKASTAAKAMGIVLLMLAAFLGMPSEQHSPARGGTVSAGEGRAAVDRAGSLAAPHGRLLRPRADALTVRPLVICAVPGRGSGGSGGLTPARASRMLCLPALAPVPGFCSTARMTILTTPRLVLRRFRLADLDALHALLSDPKVMRFSSSGVMDRRRAAEWLDWNIRMYAPRGPGVWAAALRTTGQVVGQVGVIPQQLDGLPEIELAYRFLPLCWGQGLGTEAAAAVRDYGFEVLQTRRLVCLIEPENHPSRRVAEKIGMTLERQVMRVDKPTCVYAVASS